MTARKHNMTAVKWITIIGGIVGTIFTILSIDWGGVAKFGHAMVFMYENQENIEHVLEDSHQVLGMRSEVDTLKAQLKEYSNRDSLIHVLELFNRGKQPYDSIWRLSQTNQWYKTTVKDHFEIEHHD